MQTENNPAAFPAAKHSTGWPSWLNPQLLPVLVLVILLGITYWLWQDTLRNTKQDLQSRFDFRVREVSGNIEQRMKSYEQVLRGVDGLFVHNEGVGRTEFHRYIARLRLQENHPGIQGIGFSTMVPAAQKEAHIAAWHKEGFPDYRIKPDGNRDSYSPIIHIEQFSGINARALGFDPYASPISRSAMERSRDLDKPIISRMIKFAPESGKDEQAGFMMYLPTYRIDSPHRSFDERRRNIIGWVSATFRMDDLMTGILGERTDDISIQIYDGEVVSGEALMYDLSEGGKPTAGALSTTHYIGVGGHTWATVITTLPGFEVLLDRNKPDFIAKIMVGGSLFLAFISGMYVRGRTRALQDAEKLAASQASYQSMFDNALDAVFLLRGNFVVDCNAAAETLLAAERTQIIGQSPVDFSPDTQADGRLSSEQAKKIKDRVYTGQQIFEWAFQRFDGSTVYCDVALRRMVIGGETLFLANVHDLTERKKAETELKRTSAQLEATLQSTLVGICYITARRHQWMNNKFAQMMGFEREELIGQPTLIHFPSEASWREIGELAYPVIGQGKPFSIDWQMKRKDGSIFWAELFGQAVDVNDPAKGSIWTYLDITHRKQAEAEIRAALEQQKELNLMKSRFVSMTSHEFRTPLTTIMSSAELLKHYNDKMPPAERAEVIESIEKGVKRMTRMLEDILTIGKVDADKIEFHPAPLPLKKFCEELIGEIRAGAQESGRNNCNIEFQIIGDNGSVYFDEKLLHHIFANLLSNAVKYSPQGGGVFFGVVCRPQEVEFTVADHGIGLASEDIDRLFETFYRASNVGNIAGTGLGLAIVKRSVDLHGGTIKVDSILGTGTRFIVTLPKRSI